MSTNGRGKTQEKLQSEKWKKARGRERREAVNYCRSFFFPFSCARRNGKNTQISLPPKRGTHNYSCCIAIEELNFISKFGMNERINSERNEANTQNDE